MVFALPESRSEARRETSSCHKDSASGSEDASRVFSKRGSKVGAFFFRERERLLKKFEGALRHVESIRHESFAGV